ncbi:MAG: UDP-glucuronic acid decarboxylase family protein [Myxococcota bacterium]
MLHVVITGGAGFIGSHLCERYLQDGHRVTAVDNLATGDLANLRDFADDPRFDYIEADVSDGMPAISDASLVMHFASPASPVDYQKLPIKTMRVGSEGTRHALELARMTGARFLMASTSEVYGDPEVHPQPEGYWGNVNPIGPRAVYDEAKRFAEAMTVTYRRSCGVDGRIIRIFNTYGPRMQLGDGRVVPTFLSKCLRGEDLPIFGNGHQSRSFCFVDDLVQGVTLLMASEQRGPINLGNPREVTIRELAATCLELFGDGRSQLVHRSLPTDDPKRRKPDITLAREALGWEPQVDLREGLIRSAPYFKAAVAAMEAREA